MVEQKISNEDITNAMKEFDLQIEVANEVYDLLAEKLGEEFMKSNEAFSLLTLLIARCYVDKSRPTKTELLKSRISGENIDKKIERFVENAQIQILSSIELIRVKEELERRGAYGNNQPKMN